MLEPEVAEIGNPGHTEALGEFSGYAENVDWRMRSQDDIGLEFAGLQVIDALLKPTRVIRIRPCEVAKASHLSRQRPLAPSALDEFGVNNVVRLDPVLIERAGRPA